MTHTERIARVVLREERATNPSSCWEAAATIRHLQRALLVSCEAGAPHWTRCPPPVEVDTCPTPGRKCRECWAEHYLQQTEEATE